MKAFAITALLAAAGAAQAGTACFLIPAPGAEASVAEGPLTRALLSRNCESLAVRAGSVRAVYSDVNGAALTPVVNAGEKFVAVDASQAGQSYAEVDLNVRGAARNTAQAPGAKFFDAATAEARKFVIPFKEIHVPAAGLSFTPRAAEPNARFEVIDEIGRRVVAAGSLGGGLRLQRSQFTPGGRYVFQLLSGGKTVASSFTVVTPDVQRIVEDNLRRIEATAGLDAASRAIARSLVYEEQSLSFNGMLAMQEMSR